MNHLLSLFLVGLFSTSLAAQNPQLGIYPQPQQVNTPESPVDFDGYELKNKKWHSFVQRTALETEKYKDEKASWKLKLDLKKRFSLENKYGKTVAGAYRLAIKNEKIEITAKDSLGLFYGLQTLSQLIHKNKITPVEIEDYPTVKYRGVVEGFYGTPWSLEDRLSQLEYYGLIKANTYIYGPKDDPYHSSPHWRKPYPEKEAQNIRKLVKASNANFVDFVWAIHPGKDIQWTEEDRDNVIQKFESMYDLGVRSFAIFFDDISGEGTNAHKQAGLLNYINAHFVKEKGDVKPLIMCPTEYNKSWANPDPDGYLSILGRELDPSIQIMWTGDSVVADITKSTLDWVQERIQRPALVWWNFPVSDYVRDHLLLGPAYGLEKGITSKKMAGILSNPMEHAEASKPAIFGVADYAWNTSAYQPKESWKKAISLLTPNATEAYLLFAANNADPGKNWHGYRRKESVFIQPHIAQLKTAIANDQKDPKNWEVVKDYYQKISQAEAKIEEAADNPALIEDIQLWLEDFTQLGKSGVAALSSYQVSAEANAATFWNTLLNHLEKRQENTEATSEKEKIKAVTGSLVLRPFVSFLQEKNNQLLLEKILGEKVTQGKNPGIGTIETNISRLEKVNLMVGKDGEIHIPAILEVFTIQPKAYFTVELSQAIPSAKIAAQFESDAKNWMKIAVSADGEHWINTKQTEKNKKITAKSTGNSIRFIRAKNMGNQVVNLRLNKFVIQNNSKEGKEKNLFTRDLNLSSFFSLKAGEELIEKGSIENPEKVVILSNAKAHPLQISVQTKAGTWKELPVKAENYLEIGLPKHTEELKITSKSGVDIYEVLWK